MASPVEARARLPLLEPHQHAQEPRPQRDPLKFIHLLYAPTNFCNMGCTYCYLGRGTDEPTGKDAPLLTLASTVDRLLAEGIVPFNISLHGGEPTAIPAAHLEALLDYIGRYYAEQGPRIAAAGLPRNPIHIKTNLYNFHRLHSLFERHRVSVSASVDLPLSLHAKYRLDKAGRSTLPRIEKNLRLLASYPHHKKISCVVTRAHLTQLDAFVDDIRHIHHEIGLDMTRFNVMFAFDSEKSSEKFGTSVSGMEMLTPDEQLRFYRHVRDAFVGGELDKGLRTHWFKEFTPDFCCSAVNCGEKFFLLQHNGDVYSCPRGQSSRRFHYGNVFEQPVADVFEAGWKMIEALENELELHDDCVRCEYLPYCNGGCTFVRHGARTGKSYTCELQKELYRAAPERYPAFAPEQIRLHAANLRFRNDIKSFSMDEIEKSKPAFVTSELHEEENALSALIAADPILQQLYSPTLFRVEVDTVSYPLVSPVLSNASDIALLRDDSEVVLHVDRGVFDIDCAEPVNNYLQLMLLRNTMVRYGDEKREKQEHLLDYNIYSRSLAASAQNSDDASDGHYRFDLAPLLRQHRRLFVEGVRNLLYVTTRSLRDYHYKKQQKNAFYHIQAINLPFPHLEFYWKHDAVHGDC
ncbi:MAG: SPASM domain-containing protein [Myxococcales bacterium]|nr:SPASM domain-containing protein [Myxococcales bacterium]